MYSLPVTTKSPAIINDSAFEPSLLFSVVWKLSFGSHEKQLRFRQSFQSARPMSGRRWGPRWSMTWFIDTRKCSNSVTSVPGWLSKGTISSSIEKSPVSFR